MAKSPVYLDGNEDAANLARALMEKPDSYVVCRDMRHAWAVESDFHVHTVTQEKGAGRTMHISRVLVCMRCETQRNEVYIQTRNSGLEKVSQHYVYPVDYSIPGVPRGVKPHFVVQQEQYRRAIEKAARAARGETQRAD